MTTEASENVRNNIILKVAMAQQPDKVVTLLGHVIIPDTVRQVIQKASAVKWGTHLLRWRYFNVTHGGETYHRDALLPTAQWHLLKRIYVDQDWPVETSLIKLDEDTRSTIQAPNTEIYVYGYHRTDPPRLQWGFLNLESGIAVVYDMEADLIATVFKPEEGSLFFTSQIGAVKIERKEWQV